MANHVEFSKCCRSVPSGLQVLEGLESFCVLFVLASCFFGRLFLFVSAYGCFGIAGCGWVYPDPMWSADTSCWEQILVLFLCIVVLDVCSYSPVCFSGSVFSSCFRSLPLGFCGGIFLFSGFSRLACVLCLLLVFRGSLLFFSRCFSLGFGALIAFPIPICQASLAFF